MKNLCGSLGVDDVSLGRTFDAMLNLPLLLMNSACVGMAGALNPFTRKRRACGGFGSRRHLRSCGNTAAWMGCADLAWEASQGEIRVASVLIENNRSETSTITFQTQPWVDSTGKLVEGGLILTPTTLVLAAGAVATVKITVNVSSPLQPGMTYYTEISLLGCPKRSISLVLSVNPDTRHDLYVPCDSCCGSRSQFLEVCGDCNCDACSCSCEGTSGSGCCDCRGCCLWPGNWDPHRHWATACDLFFLPRPSVGRTVAGGGA